MYTALFVWLAAKVTFWLGTLSEEDCPSSIVALLGTTSATLFGLVLVHLLVYASCHGSPLISVKYERERLRLLGNSRTVRRRLSRLLLLAYAAALLASLLAVPLLLLEGSPRSAPGSDGSLSCQLGWGVLWLEAASCTLLAAFRVLIHLYQIDSFEAAFMAHWVSRSISEEYKEGSSVSEM